LSQAVSTAFRVLARPLDTTTRHTGARQRTTNTLSHAVSAHDHEAFYFDEGKYAYKCENPS
jgi:hypothetical protein